MTLRAAELSAPSKPVPYYRRRIAELVAEGRAAIRAPGHPPTTAAVRMHRTATRLSWVFASRLAAMQEVRVYYSPSGYKLALRRQNPRPALNGKIYIQKLPADAEYVGRYSYPHSRRDFVRDLIETMGECRAAPACAANLSADQSPTIHGASVRSRTSVRQPTREAN